MAGGGATINGDDLLLRGRLSCADGVLVRHIVAQGIAIAPPIGEACSPAFGVTCGRVECSHVSVARHRTRAALRGSGSGNVARLLSGCVERACPSWIRSTIHMYKRKPRTRKTNPRARRQPNQPKPVTLPRDVYDEMEESSDRMIRRWARKLLLVGDGEVRHLTAEEVESMVAASRRSTAGRFFKPVNSGKRR